MCAIRDRHGQTSNLLDVSVTSLDLLRQTLHMRPPSSALLSSLTHKSQSITHRIVQGSRAVGGGEPIHVDCFDVMCTLHRSSPLVRNRSHSTGIRFSLMLPTSKTPCRTASTGTPFQLVSSRALCYCCRSSSACMGTSFDSGFHETRHTGFTSLTVRAFKTGHPSQRGALVMICRRTLQNSCTCFSSWTGTTRHCLSPEKLEQTRRGGGRHSGPRPATVQRCPVTLPQAACTANHCMVRTRQQALAAGGKRQNSSIRSQPQHAQGRQEVHEGIC
jgi:hypothetical protein